MAETPTDVLVAGYQDINKATNNFDSLVRDKQVSTEPIPPDDVAVRMQFDADRQEHSAGGTVSLYANDQMIGEGRLETTVSICFSAYVGMDIGRDSGLVVDVPTRPRRPTPSPAPSRRSSLTSSPRPGKRTRKPWTRPRPTARRRTASAPGRPSQMLQTTSPIR